LINWYAAVFSTHGGGTEVHTSFGQAGRRSGLCRCPPTVPRTHSDSI